MKTTEAETVTPPVPYTCLSIAAGGPLAHGASASVGVGHVPPLPLQCGAAFGSSGGSRGRGARRRLPVAADDNDDIPPAEVPINYFS